MTKKKRQPRKSAARAQPNVPGSFGERAIAKGDPDAADGSRWLDGLGTRLAASVNTLLADLEPLELKVDTGMDPRLQLALLNHRAGKPGVPTASTGGDEIAVIAKVVDAQDWEDIPDVVKGAVLGKTPDGLFIVTGRIPVHRIEAVRQDPTVRSLKASQVVQPCLTATTRSMKLGPFPAAADPRGGAGVVIGIVDIGCDFAHRNFRDAHGRTRLLALWDQGGTTTAHSPFGYGRLHLPEDINKALTQTDPYAAIGYGPERDTPVSRGAHGTHVMDIAAGNGRGSGAAGLAPEADLVFVEVSLHGMADDGPATVGQTFGDLVQLAEALRFVFDTAGDRPCVVNLSLGTYGGPHDGSSLLELGIDAMLEERGNRAIVVAASNSQDRGIHTSGDVPATGSLDLGWRIRGKAGGEFELWYPGAARLRATLIAPDGLVVATVVPDENRAFSGRSGPALFLSSRLADPNNHDNVIGIWIAAGLPEGDWTVQLESLLGDVVPFHAWVERFDPSQSSFVRPVSSHTLGSISTSRHSIVVGSYDAHKPSFPLSSFSSAGPTRDGRQKPELSAPGHAVMAAHSRTSFGTIRKSGTSMAAPAVTGLVALMLAQARAKGQTLGIGEIRQRLMSGLETAMPTAPAGTWHPRYGMGRVSGKVLG